MNRGASIVGKIVIGDGFEPDIEIEPYDDIRTWIEEHFGCDEISGKRVELTLKVLD